MLKLIFSFLVYISVTAFTFFILTFIFNDELLIYDENSAVGELVNYSVCKIPGDTSFSYGHGTNEDCVDYRYDGNGTLYLRHINSGFSIYPGELTATINITDNSITIEESELDSWCGEMGLYNLEYVIKNLNTGIYSVRVVSPYLGDEKPLEFNVDLSEAGKGSCYLHRNNYPWGT